MRPHFLLVSVVLIITMPGCTIRVWYGGMQAAAKQACLHQPPSEQSNCEARLNKDDFDTYQEKRRASSVSTK